MLTIEPARRDYCVHAGTLARWYAGWLDILTQFHTTHTRPPKPHSHGLGLGLGMAPANLFSQSVFFEAERARSVLK